MRLIKLWCEYDHGQDDFVFADQDSATAWLVAATIHEDEEYRAVSLFEEGLAGFSIVTLIGKIDDN